MLFVQIVVQRAERCIRQELRALGNHSIGVAPGDQAVGRAEFSDRGGEPAESVSVVLKQENRGSIHGLGWFTRLRTAFGKAATARTSVTVRTRSFEALAMLWRCLEDCMLSSRARGAKMVGLWNWRVLHLIHESRWTHRGT